MLLACIITLTVFISSNSALCSVKFYRNNGCFQCPSFLKHFSSPASSTSAEVKQHKPLVHAFSSSPFTLWKITSAGVLEFLVCSEAFYSFLDDCRLNYPKLSVFVLSEGANEGANRQWFNHKGNVEGLFCGSELLVMQLKK